MARLLKSDRTTESRGRRLSFKTREKRSGVRAVRVVSGNVPDLAAKFNAVVVEDQERGRALLKKLQTQQQGTVRAAVQKFETMQGHKVVLVRKNSMVQESKEQKIKPKVHPKPNIDRKTNGRYVKKDLKELLGKDKKFSLPKTQILNEILNEIPEERKEPETSEDNERLSESSKNTPHDSKPTESYAKTTDSKKTKVKPSGNTKINDVKAKLFRQVKENNITPNIIETIQTAKVVNMNSTEAMVINDDISEKEASSIVYENSKPKHNSDNSSTEPKPTSTPTIVVTLPEPKKLEKQTIEPNRNNKEKEETTKNIKPNRSFLWGAKESTSESEHQPVTETKPVVKDKEVASVITESILKVTEVLMVSSQPTSDRLVEDKENLEKLETPVIRTVDKKGYGKIMPNSSTLYREILRQSLIEELKEKHEGKEKIAVLKDRTENVPLYCNVPVQQQDTYEDVGQDTYEIIENNYDEIKEEAIYDDVLNVNTDQIYECIYNGKIQGDSDSSFEQNNSLYDHHRPPSRASSGSGARESGASRSDTSEDWIDIEQENTEEKAQHILVIQGGHKKSGINWSQKVRRQWSTRRTNSVQPQVAITSSSVLYLKYDDTSNFEPDPNREVVHPVPLATLGLVSLREVWYSGNLYEVQEVTIYILNKEDSDSSSKHYELVENLDDDSALCDDFEDSSDSEFSVDNKPYIHEPETIREGSQSDGIYGLMKEAGKRMKKTSSTIGKSLRKISRISKTTSAQDIFNGTNNMMSRGRWPSFKKKNSLPQTKSTFYLTDSGTSVTSTGSTTSIKVPERSSVPPPRPPPPLLDPRRLSLSTRPTSPPPPPPPTAVNGTSSNDPKVASANKAINDTSLYAECGLFEQNPISANQMPDMRRMSSNCWYSDIGLYENSKPSDTSSEHESSQGSDLDLRFADEPLYQFYTERAAKRELAEDVSETGYEEIGENRNVLPASRPSALELVDPQMQRTLWCQVPQVIDSGILDSLSQDRKRLQEAKFEVVTSEASYYKSLTILEKHFAASPLLKDESVLPKVHYKTLFGNVATVRKCSEAVLAALDKCWQESILLEGLSDIINKVAEEHFSAYIKYCKHQLAMEKTIKTLKKSNQAFSDALDTLQKSPKCHNLTFYSFALLPMQRITRMPLLQDAILTKLTPDDPEYESCRLALARLNKIVHDCNEAARQTERLEEMALLSRSLQFPPEVRPLPLLSASRWLVRSGDVSQISLEARTTFSRKLTAPRTVKLRLFLFTDYLVIAKRKGDDSFTVVTYCERNLIQMADVEEAFSNKFLIMLTLLKNHEGKTQEMVLCCGGESSRARWISAMSPPAPTNPGETLYEDWDCPQVFVQHAYLAVQPDELSLQYGDVINVLRKTDDGWYYGERMRDSEKGWFPGNHTNEIPSSHVRARNLKQRYRLLALSSSFIQKQQMSKLSVS